MSARQFATDVVEKLQAAGFESLWAGGCVRDSVLGIPPKDYDVATSATPNEVQSLFGRNRTLAIGKSFGVITVIGPKSVGNIEVATFRRDGNYSDGRRPDSVEFTNAKEDALRRDFTINGMFFDPVTESVIDYVGGQEDLSRKLIRAIGDAEERIEEDRLRMLRGVRFAATYGFDVEPATMAAIQKRASDIESVSPERIGAELRRMLSHSSKARALSLLIESGLWQQVFPNDTANKTDWSSKVRLLEDLDGDFATALAAILRGTGLKAARLQNSWRLKNEEVSRTDWILVNELAISRATDLPWSELQPLLVSQHATFAIGLLEAIAKSDPDPNLAASIELCRTKLSLERKQLDPAPLIDGKDLKEMGMSPGPEFKSILNDVRKMQLDGQLTTVTQAKDWVRSKAL